MKQKQNNHFGFIRVAAAVPPLKVSDIQHNTTKIIEYGKKSANLGASITVFPELSITGYTAGDLFHQHILLHKARQALLKIRDSLKSSPGVFVVGLPIESEGKLFNAAAIIAEGKILGLVPKTYIPGYKEFYEERWFSAARDITTKELDFEGITIPFGRDLLFKLKGIKGAVLGVEICEDLWTPLPPSSFQVLSGATIIANLSASNELVGKADYRRSLVTQQSARGVCGYIYTSCGVHESTTDVVFDGHAIIAENGVLLQESKRFARDGELIISDIDLEHIATDRMRTTSFGESIHESTKKDFRIIDVPISLPSLTSLHRLVDPHPFAPEDTHELSRRNEEIFAIQTAGLAKRLEYSKLKKVIIGVSGGLDSTLTLLVATKTFDLLNWPRKNIHAFTMPGFATSKRTKSNAVRLTEALGVTLETIPITKGATQHLEDINHDGTTQDITFQNVQARYRTMILMDKANQLQGIVVGTGDLSEIALGWNTFTGDHISHYNVNAGIPKTLVRHLVEWISAQKEFDSSKKVLKDIVATPISPELVRSKKSGVTQKTENIIGPYELHDFFLYHFLRWGSSPQKILFLAEKAFGKKYKRVILTKWLRVFLTRFFSNQWKRSVMPDGPKVGSIALSPRGDWRMPSDAEAKLWLNELT